MKSRRTAFSMSAAILAFNLGCTTPAPTPTAPTAAPTGEIIVVKKSVNPAGCSSAEGACALVTCSVRNVGTATGAASVRAELLIAGAKPAPAKRTTLVAGADQDVSFMFPLGGLDAVVVNSNVGNAGDSRANCFVEAAKAGPGRTSPNPLSR